MSEAATLDLADGVYDLDSKWQGMVMADGGDGDVIVAAGFPVKPPAEWFTDPGLTQLTPMTITADGRVYGHIAAWHTSHIGMAGGIKPPRSKSNYAYFRTGSIQCDDDSFVDVGQITLVGGHAPLEASVPQAVAHYDNTASAMMDVAAGEDKHGIWVAGALRPDVTDAQLRALRASSVSGDWRPINGRLELVAVCNVNTPGFPIPRARVASGVPIALVAAGIEPLIARTIQMRAEVDVEAGIEAGLASFRERLTKVEDVVLASLTEGPLATEEAEALRQRVHGIADEMAAATSEEPEEDPRVVELRNRVHGVTADVVEAPVDDDTEARIIELRRRVRPEVIQTADTDTDTDTDIDTTWDDGLDIEVPIAAALRARVHGVGG